MQRRTLENQWSDSLFECRALKDTYSYMHIYDNNDFPFTAHQSKECTTILNIHRIFNNKAQPTNISNFN